MCVHAYILTYIHIQSAAVQSMAKRRSLEVDHSNSRIKQLEGTIRTLKDDYDSRNRQFETTVRGLREEISCLEGDLTSEKVCMCVDMHVCACVSVCLRQLYVAEHVLVAQVLDVG
jgi:hypothetical protein